MIEERERAFYGIEIPALVVGMAGAALPDRVDERMGALPPVDLPGDIGVAAQAEHILRVLQRCMAAAAFRFDIRM
jgi:hypothetical protein